MTLSFSNKRPISIAIDISAVTRYARLMDPRLSLRRTPCCPVPFTNPYPPFYLPRWKIVAPVGRAHPLPQSIRHSSAHPLSLSLFLHLYLFVVLPPSPDLQILPSIRSVSLSDLIKENTRNARYTHTYVRIGHDDCIEYHRFRIFDSKSRLRDGSDDVCGDSIEIL